MGFLGVSCWHRGSVSFACHDLSFLKGDDMHLPRVPNKSGRNHGWTYLLQVIHPPPQPPTPPMSSIMSVHTPQSLYAWWENVIPSLHSHLFEECDFSSLLPPPLLALWSPSTVQTDKRTCCWQQYQTRDMSSSIKDCTDWLCEWWMCVVKRREQVCWERVACHDRCTLCFADV